MTWQLRHEIAKTAMRGFTFTHPVEQADVDYVAQALRVALPGCTVTVKIDHPRFVGVRVDDEEGLAVYSQEHVVIG